MLSRHMHRIFVYSTRCTLPSPSRPLSTLVCKGCLQQQISQAFRSNFGSSRRVVPSVKRWMATNTDGSAEQSSQTSQEKPKKESSVSSPDNSVNNGNADLSAKVQAKLKVKTSRKKTDFTKEYLDNIYVESHRAKQEYLLSQEQLDALPFFLRRSPYPSADNIKVYHREELRNKVIQIWGSLENFKKEKERRKDWEHLDAHPFRVRKAEYGDKIHEVSPDEKPFIFKPFESPEDEGVSDSIFKSGPGKVVLWAIAVNGTNVLMKFVAWLYTGSHSMFAECIHSMADTVNQIILAIGIHQSLKKADPEHPYGWSNFRNVASLISGVGIFCLGAGFSIYHGIMGLLHPHAMESLYWGIAILGGSFLSEGGTLLVAINQVRHSAKQENMSFMNYVWQGRDPSTNVVLLEDAAAVVGVALAAACMGITYYTGNPVSDAIGSLLVGSLLGGVASFIIYTNTIALVGRSIPVDQKSKLMEELENDRMIRALHDVKATDMGAQYVRFKAEVDFDGKEITRLYLEKSDLEALLNEVQTMKSPEELETFMLKHGESIVDTIGSEVDRIEKTLKKRHPEVRHVDLEQL